MMRKTLMRVALLFLACGAMGILPHLCAQSLTVQTTSQIAFALNSLAPANGNLPLAVTVTCGGSCSAMTSVYAYFEDPNNALTPLGGGSGSIPSSRVLAQVTGHAAQSFTGITPLGVGSGVTLIDSAMLPSGVPITVTSALQIDARNLRIPPGTYQGQLIIMVSSF